MELPDDWPVLIDRIPLQLLDLVIDPFGECSIGNPAHGGEQMIEMYLNSRARRHRMAKKLAVKSRPRAPVDFDDDDGEPVADIDETSESHSLPLYNNVIRSRLPS